MPPGAWSPYDEGRRARLAGQPVTANPYFVDIAMSQWEFGWRSIDRAAEAQAKKL